MKYGCIFCEKDLLGLCSLLAYKLLPNTTKTNYQQPEKLKFTQQQKQQGFPGNSELVAEMGSKY